MPTPERTLAIECATEACSIALFEDGEVRAAEHRVLGRGHAEHLVPMIATLPDRGKAARILVSLGPGSFTGVRIGIAVARALGVAWNVPVAGYPTLALIAAMAQAEHPGPVTVCIAGGHGEWFMQDFDPCGLPETALASVRVGEAAEVASHRVIAGSQAGARAEMAGPGHLAFVTLPDARFASRLPHALITSSTSPIYGRAPDARLPA
jgi:tRNA threonylcarbamoyl adenosine modification protein YeaZ